MKHLARTILFSLALGLSAVVCLAQETTPPPPPPKPTPDKIKPKSGATITVLPSPEYDPKSWKEFSSAEGRFTAQFPGAPRKNTQVVAVPGGQLEVHIYELQTFAEYSVIYSDYPSAPSSAAVAGRVLDNVVKNAVKAINATLLSATEISIEGHPGRLVKQRLPGGSILRAKFYLVGRRLYQVAITTPPEEGASAASVRFSDEFASRFLDSFKLKPLVTGGR